MSDLYVDPQSGNDTTGDGSSGTPWKSLQKAIDNAAGGDTILMANTAADVLSAPISWSSGWGGGTSADAQLIITAWDNGGSLVINHPCGNIDCWELDGDDAVATLFSTTSIPQYVTLVQGKLHSTTGYLIAPTSYWAVLLGELYDAGGSAIVNYLPYGLIAGCYLHDFSASCKGVKLANSGMAMGNYVDSPTGTGISGHARTCVANNIIKSAAGSGIDMEGDGALLFNNTIVGDGSGTNAGIRLFSINELVVAVGNIITDFADGYGIRSDAGANFRLIGHNHFHNNGTDKSGVVVKGLDLGGDVYADPGFVDAAGGDFRIGTAGKAKGWPMGWPGSDTLNFLDTGAAQRLEQAMIRVGMSGGMNG